MKQLLALLALLLIVSCTAQPAAEPTPLESAPAVETVPSENVTPSVEVTPAERMMESGEELKQKVIAEEEARIQEAVAHPQKFAPRNRTNTVGDALDETFSSIKSYQFKNSKGTFYVLGSKVRAVLTDPIRLTHVQRGDVNLSEIYLDELIIDRSAKTAAGYCLGYTETVRKQCANLQIFDTDFKIDFATYNPKLPEDWSREFANKEVTDESEQKYYLNSIETTRVAFADGTEMYIFPKAGLPIKIMVGPLEGITFDNMVINQVGPEDVIHRPRAEIPPQENFYKTY